MDQKDQKHGYFVVSLDFELFWGMFDKLSLKEYGARIRGERSAIPRMLALFTKYGIHATWGVVGMTMARSKSELCPLLPASEDRPQYTNTELSSYTHLDSGRIEEADIHYFGRDLIEKIAATPFQEIGNHTFSHYYCLEPQKQRDASLRADFDAHAKISEMYELQTTSLIFPRNQYDSDALHIAKEKGMTAFRGTENHFLYRTRNDDHQSLIIRAFRLLDHYINISGYHAYPFPTKEANAPLNIPASRFFRPWSRVLQLFESLRLRRIKNAMTYAAKHGEIFHLWWHPHNVAIDQEKNFKNLEIILNHYATLQKTYTMQSASMRDIANM